MAVFRIDKTRDYTVMANFHLRDTSLSLKAKGLLSLMLSLPETWDYTTKGLARICKDGVDSICATVKELEKAGYVQRRRLRDELGRLAEVEYTILEKPVIPAPEEEPPKPEKPVQAEPESEEPISPASETPKRENPVLDNPVLVSPVLDSPKLASPKQACPELENPAQLNTNTSSKEKLNTDLSNTHSFFPSAEETCNSGRTERRITSGEIRAQIEYEIMVQRYRRDQLDELVEIMLEVALNRSPTIRIGRDAEYPTYFVQERFRKINALHIEKVMEGIAENRTRVYNTKAYLMAALFNSVSTIDHHYTMQYNADADDYGSL
ncbi:MAG: helix-turn-helix domain-containing protein [Oscillospiraceae bacterium]|nr:helix-turn-helix domain-containing protein [Oscillospiraceae bacterium]MBQ7002321.1 helix-turn-helix domain-containing protein [Oscillospiraceae bacterium]